MKKVLCLLLSLSCYGQAMTVEEKVGQILMCPVFAERVDEEVKDFIQETKIGGVILTNWCNNLDEEDDIASFTSDLQLESIKNTGAPLLIGIDQEGKKIQRIQMDIDDAEEIGESRSTKDAYKTGKEIGDTLRKCGINLNFAPVVDLYREGTAEFLKERCFGGNPWMVSEMAKAFAEGLDKKGVYSCLKHFPGHGSAGSDPHLSLPLSKKSAEELFALDLIPYKELHDSVSFIMTSHILFPNIDSDYPVSLSKKFLTGILRDTLGYKGVIISDSIRMDAVLTKPMHEVAIDAFNAGSDIILIGGNRLIEEDPSLNAGEIRLLHKELVAAVQDGRISMERLDESVARVLAAKAALQIRVYQ